MHRTHFAVRCWCQIADLPRLTLKFLFFFSFCSLSSITLYRNSARKYVHHCMLAYIYIRIQVQPSCMARVCACVCVCVCVCMYVCMYVCMRVYARMYVRMYACMCLCMYIICVCMYVCARVRVCVCVHVTRVYS